MTSSTPRANGLSSSGTSFCAACGAARSSSARFCHRCGTPVGDGLPVIEARSATNGAPAAASVLPWGIAFLALLALVVVFAGQNVGKANGSSVDGSSNAPPTATLNGQSVVPVVPASPFAAGTAAVGTAPNITNMSPSERASRLYVRVMEYAESGKVDSVARFAPMVMAAHEMLERPTLDERYHYGRVAEVVGTGTIVTAQADTILRARPTSLLGLLLGARAARMDKNEAAARGFDERLLGALEAELATKNADYEHHRAEIDRAVADARKN